MLDWQLLTKRPENVLRMVPAHWRGAFPDNVWMGTTCENQEMADKRIPELLEIPARVRFLSCEPLLGPVNLAECAPMVLDGQDWNPSVTNAFNGMCHHPKTCVEQPFSPGSQNGIHWVIIGGESGPKARPMHPDWARSIRDQCVAAGVPVFFKQWGEWLPGNGGPGGDLYEIDRTQIKSGFFSYCDSWHAAGANPFRQTMDRVGKEAAGRTLDGRTWDEMPSPSAPCDSNSSLQPVGGAA